MSERRSPDCAEIYDWLKPSRPLKEEEAQAAAVSDFLSFVPSQILKQTRQYSRQIIPTRSKKLGEG